MTGLGYGFVLAVLCVGVLRDGGGWGLGGFCVNGDITGLLRSGCAVGDLERHLVGLRFVKRPGGRQSGSVNVDGTLGVKVPTVGQRTIVRG